LGYKRFFDSGFSFSAMSLAFIKVAQQSVHPTLGSLRDLQAFFWLRVFSTSQTLSAARPSAGNANR